MGKGLRGRGRHLGWREEIAAALGEWLAVEGGAGRQPRWQRVGRAARTGEPGQYAVDLRGSDIGPDQLDGLRLAGPERAGPKARRSGTSSSLRRGTAEPSEPGVRQFPQTMSARGIPVALSSLCDRHGGGHGRLLTSSTGEQRKPRRPGNLPIRTQRPSHVGHFEPRARVEYRLGASGSRRRASWTSNRPTVP